ncbi:MAG: hypothetical protein NC453_16690 [Muribaculum sp.]|nr:hypothetical protein [Muribaculum sp.]
MDIKTKIRKLWDYLKVQDDELLIVLSFNATTNSDDYIVAEMIDGQIEITVRNQMPDLFSGKPFQLIQQIGENGKHKIPSVEQLKSDELIDY